MPSDHSPPRPRAFELSLVQEMPTLFARALLLEKKRASAEDLLQDVVERALRNWNRFRPGSSLRRWLFTIMHNLFVDRCRRRRCRPHVNGLPEVGELSAQGEAELPVWESVSVFAPRRWSNDCPAHCARPCSWSCLNGVPIVKPLPSSVSQPRPSEPGCLARGTSYVPPWPRQKFPRPSPRLLSGLRPHVEPRSSLRARLG